MEERRGMKQDGKQDAEKLEGLQRQNDALRSTCTRQREELQALCQANRELSCLMDNILIAIAVRYGQARTQGGEVLGYRLTIPREHLLDGAKSYEVKARKDEKAGEFVIGVVRRDCSDEGDKAALQER